MKRRAILAVLAAAASAGCGASPAAPTTSPTQSPSVSACGAIAGERTSGAAILNGSSCQPANSPVVLLTLQDSTSAKYASCSGTVIAPRAVLTAAHCVAGPASIIITFGTTDYLMATSFQAIPAYRGENTSSSIDVGVVLTGQDFGQIPLPVLVSGDVVVGQQAVIAGWGLDQINTRGVLHAGTTSITGVDSLTIQTHYSAGSNGSGVCFGDSGGPLLVSQAGAWAVAGVTSSFSGDSNACSSATNYFVSVRNPAVISFLSSLVTSLATR